MASDAAARGAAQLLQQTSALQLPAAATAAIRAAIMAR